MTDSGKIVVGVSFTGPVMGGLERTVCRLVEILQGLDFHVVALTSRSSEEDFHRLPEGCERLTVGGWKTPAERASRLQLIKEAVRVHRIDVVFLHQYYSDVLGEEVSVVHELGAKAVVHCHSAATSWLVRRSGSLDVGRQFEAFRAADAVIALSSANEVLLRLLGVKACYIPNPVEDVPAGFLHAADSNAASVVWMGRFDASVKRPLDAVKIFERILSRLPHATLTMVGNDGGGEEAEVRDYLASRPPLKASVALAGRRKDVWPYLARANIMLFTSAVEGFPGVVAEAYAAGVPIVGYALPFVDLCRDSDAYHAVEQGDVESAAVLACGLLSSAGALGKSSDAAREMFERYAGVDLAASYRGLVGELLSGNAHFTSLEVDDRVREAVAGLFAHACACRRLYVSARKKLAERSRPLWLRALRRIKRML